MLVFVGKGGRKTVQKVKNYSSSKILRIRAPCYFQLIFFCSRKGKGDSEAAGREGGVSEVPPLLLGIS